MRALRSLASCLGAIALWGMLLGGGAGLPESASSAVAANSPRLDTTTLHAVPAAAPLPSGCPPAVADVRPSGTAEGGDPTGESSSLLASARRSASVLGQALNAGRVIARAERTCAMLCVFLCWPRLGAPRHMLVGLHNWLDESRRLRNGGVPWFSVDT